MTTPVRLTITISGVAGAGKTTLAHLVAKHLFHSTDAEVILIDDGERRNLELGPSFLLHRPTEITVITKEGP